MSETKKNSAIDICRRNASVAKEKAQGDRERWRQDGIDLITRHPWIKAKRDEIVEVFGPIGGMRIFEDGKLKWRWPR